VTDVVDATHPYTQAVEKVVYLLEGTQLGYASRELWNI
jgi:precorrin-6x reductase